MRGINRLDGILISDERMVQIKACMYQYSRAIYRSIKDLVDPYVDPETRIEYRRQVLEACEQTMERLATDPLYFAKPRLMLVRGESLISVEQPIIPRLPGEQPQVVMCRMRSLGCSPCTGAIRSEADTVPQIIEELVGMRRSERQNRVIDHDQDGSMELKKQEGYF